MARNRADKYTDKTFSQLESQISRMYKEAQKDINQKLLDFTKRHRAKDRDMKQKLKKGEITQEQYNSWLTGQIFIGNQWKHKKEQITESIKHVMQEASNVSRGKAIDVFAENANYTAFEIEKDLGAQINFGLYDAHTVSRLIRDEPELLPRKVVNGKKLEAWNQKVIANSISQGIIQGESIDEISKRIARDTCISAGRSSTLYARTAVTGAQNAGRMERLHEAKDMGINVKKRWMATLDNRTRDAHAELDGQTVDVDEPFQSDLGPIMYPGDPTANPANVYNCRCTLVYIYPEYEQHFERTAYYEQGDPEYDPRHRNYETVRDMTYEQWVEYKQNQIRARYGGEPKFTPKPEPKPKDDRFLTFDSEEDNRRLEEQREENRRLIEEQKKLATDFYKSFEDEEKIDKEIRELDRLEKVAQKDYSMFDRFQTEADLKKYRNDIDSRIEKLDEEMENLVKPRRDDFSTDEEYERAFNDYLSKKISIREERENLERDLDKTYNDMPPGGWSKIEEWRNAIATDEEVLWQQREDLKLRKEEIRANRKEIRRKQDENARKLDTNNEAKIVDEASSRGVEYKAPERFTTQPSVNEIVSRLGGGDETQGSCASLGFCYIGQKNGIDVLDFRDGESRTMFARDCCGILRGIAEETGKPLLTEFANSGTGGAIRLLKQCEPGKEYYFVVGRHAAIVRKADDHFEYMELQSRYENGWKWLGFKESDPDNRTYLDKAFKNRFGCSSHINGEAMMMDINDMKDSKVLQRSYGYMNTAVDKQHKGDTGHER